MAIEIKPGEHVFIGGRTGSGKTYLARKYLAGFNHVVCLDTKGTLEWPEIPEKELAITDNLFELQNIRKEKIIYKPRFEEMNFEFYNEFFRWCYLRGNTTVWIDEVMAVCPTPYKMPEYYQAILTRGRELNVSAWSLSQRPSGIPVLTMSESTHFFVFDLNMPQDREKMYSITGAANMLKKPGTYQFWYYNIYSEDAYRAKLVERRGKNG